MWLLGLALIPGGLLSALIAAYTRRSVEGAEGREAMLNKVFDALPMGIWVRSRSGETVLVNARWMSFAADPEGADGARVPLGEEWAKEANELLESEDGATTTALWSCATGMVRSAR